MFHLFTEPVNKIFDSLGGNVRLVGGCVRDSLLNKDFSDIDFATPLKPTQTMGLLITKGIKVIPIGIEFGTVVAVIDGKNYQITTLRKDEQTDGRYAKVKFIDSYQQDAFRRDFTINALSVDVNQVIYDYTEGFSDLQEGIVRFIGNPFKRIQEDYLRILRLFRFWGFYGNKPIEKEALLACCELRKGLEKVSKERQKSEILKILSTPKPQETLFLMDETQILETLFNKEVNLKAWEKLISENKTISPIIQMAVLNGQIPDFPLTRKEKNILKEWNR